MISPARWNPLIASAPKHSTRHRKSLIEFSHGFVSIAPEGPSSLGGRAGPPRIAEKAHGTLEASILAVFFSGAYRAVFISIDVLFVGRELTDLLLSSCAGFGVPNQCVLIVATHTHTAPVLEDTKPLLGALCPVHFAGVRKKLIGLLSDVLSAPPQEGKLTKGRSSINASVNRRLPWHLPRLTRSGIQFDRTVLAPNENGPVAPLLTALVIKGATTAVIWHYTCHPSGFPEEKVSADYPDIVRKALRQRFGKDTTPIFLQGFTGDIRPISAPPPGGFMPFARRAVQGPRFYDMPIEDWLKWAGIISDRVLQAIDRATPVEDGGLLYSQVASVTLDQLMVGADPTRLVELQRLHVLGERIVAVSAEPTLGLKGLCPQETLLVGYSRDVFGYWPREQEIDQGGYEVDGFKSWFGVPHNWQSDSDSVFSRLVGPVSPTSPTCAVGGRIWLFSGILHRVS